MKTRYFGPPKSILALVVVIIIGWAVACNALEHEQWDAKATARVNLRNRPSSKGAILSVIPKGHIVRVTQEKGLWRKVDVQGEILGKGWVYGKYLEKTITKIKNNETVTHSVSVEIAAAKQKPVMRPAEVSPKTRSEVEKIDILKVPLFRKMSLASVKAQSAVLLDLRETNNQGDALSGVEIPMTFEPMYMVAAQEPPGEQVSDENPNRRNAAIPAKAPMDGLDELVLLQKQLQGAKNETSLLAQVEIPLTGAAAPLFHTQSTTPDHTQDAFGVSRKFSSGVIEQGDSSAYQKHLSGKKKKPAEVIQETLPAAIGKSMSDVRVAASSLIGSTVSHVTKGLVIKRGAMGARPIEVALKLMSIVLSGLVVLLLYKGELRCQTLNLAGLFHHTRFDIASLLKKFTSRTEKLA